MIKSGKTYYFNLRLRSQRIDEMQGIVDKKNLGQLYGEPSERAVLKQLDHLDKHCQAFIEISPFLVIGTMGSDGLGDVSPRGDAPGFVKVKDEKTIYLPDRLGNNRTDTLSNVLENSGVGLLFLVPGAARHTVSHGIAWYHELRLVRRAEEENVGERRGGEEWREKTKI